MTENKTYNSMEIRGVMNGWHLGFKKEEYKNMKINVKEYIKND